MNSKKHIHLSYIALLVIAIALVIWFNLKETSGKSRPIKSQVPTPSPVTVLNNHTIKIDPQSPLYRKMSILQLQKTSVSIPMLTMTGTVIAKRKSGLLPQEDNFEFNSQELSAIYADWQKYGTDIAFLKKQILKTQELIATQLRTQKTEVERLRKLVEIGTEAARDLNLAESNLLQTQLEGQKSLFDLQNAMVQAKHSFADAERRLLQAGVDVELLAKLGQTAVLVAGDVPEVSIDKIKVNQQLAARFYGHLDKVFTGRVQSISPSLSIEKRTLKVFFTISDQNGELIPGMFSDIGLGTDARDSLLIPSDALIHIRDKDYVFRMVQDNQWQVTEVKVGERFDANWVEILDGLTEEEKVIGHGAILLKPIAEKVVMTITSLSKQAA